LILLFSSVTTAFAFQPFELSCGNVDQVCVHERQGAWFLTIQLDQDGAVRFFDHQRINDGDVVSLVADGNCIGHIKAYKRPRKERESPLAVQLRGVSKDEVLAFARWICPDKTVVQGKGQVCQIAGVSRYALSKGEETFAYPLSCEDIDYMELWKLRSDILDGRGGRGYVYVLGVRVMGDGGTRLNEFTGYVNNRCCQREDGNHYKAYIHIESNGETMQSHAPLFDNHGEDFGSLFTFGSPQAAMQAARMICPAKAPNLMRGDDGSMTFIK